MDSESTGKLLNQAEFHILERRRPRKCNIAAGFHAVFFTAIAVVILILISQKKCENSCPIGYKITPGYFGNSCDCTLSEDDMVYGDIKFTPESLVLFLQQFKRKSTNWDLVQKVYPSKWHFKTSKKGQWLVPYVIQDSFDDKELAMIENAMNFFNQDTCVRFQAKEYLDEKFLKIVKADNCWSYLGQAHTEQELSLTTNCMTLDGLVHMLMHALGFNHEHARPDRDDFVTVNYDNIKEDSKIIFDKIDDSYAKMFTLYDINSSMHITSNIFTNNNTLPTLINKVTGKSYKRDVHGFTETDVKKIAYDYPCNLDKVLSRNAGHWSDWSTCSKSCGGGYSYRYRTCGNFHGTIQNKCGHSTQIRKKCMSMSCELFDSWGAWSDWSACSSKNLSDTSMRQRIRECLRSDGCFAPTTELKVCPVEQKGLVWSNWSEWSACSTTCGENSTRIRTVDCFMDGEPSRNCTGFKYLDYSMQNHNRAVQRERCRIPHCTNVPMFTQGYSHNSTLVVGNSTIWNNFSSLNFTGNERRRRMKRAMGGSFTEKSYTYVCIMGYMIVGKFTQKNHDEIACVERDGSLYYFENNDLTKRATTAEFALCGMMNTNDDKFQILTADFSGDGFTDVLCMDMRSVGDAVIYFNQGNGNFRFHKFHYFTRCSSLRDFVMYAADINGDKLPEVLCGPKDKGPDMVFYNLYGLTYGEYQALFL